jgi:hypothetical protein
MGAFISGLLGGYTEIALKAEERKHEEAMADKRARVQVLQAAINSGRLSPDAEDAAFSQIEELTGGGKKGKKGQMGFRDVMGRLLGRTPQREGLPSLESTMTKRQPAAGPAPKPVAGTQQPQGFGVPPQRAHIFKTPQEMTQEKIEAEKSEFEQVTKPELDYQHKQRLEEIKAQYGNQIVRQETKILGSSVPLKTDANGNPIDPAKSYTVLYNREGQPVAALQEAAPASRLSGPEAKIDSMKKDITADAKAKGHPITDQQAEIQARQMALADARNAMYSRLETLRGKQFANSVRQAIESGRMTPMIARGIISYVSSEARLRFANDPEVIRRGLSVSEVEDEIFTELNTTRGEVATYLRQGGGTRSPGSFTPQPSRPFNTLIPPGSLSLTAPFANPYR